MVAAASRRQPTQYSFCPPPTVLTTSAPSTFGGVIPTPALDRIAQMGVAVVSIPQCGGLKTPERRAYERSRAFKEGQRLCAGIEGRISVLFRDRGMKRCRAEGRERFELWVGVAVLANNLMKIAGLRNKRTRGKLKPPDTSGREISRKDSKQTATATKSVSHRRKALRRGRRLPSLPASDMTFSL